MAEPEHRHPCPSARSDNIFDAGDIFLGILSGDGKDSTGVPSSSLLSSGKINTSTIVVTVVDNATIVPAVESTAGTETEALPFNF